MRVATLASIGAQNGLGGDSRREERHAMDVRHLWDLRHGVALGNTRNTPEAFKTAPKGTPDLFLNPDGFYLGVRSYRDSEPTPSTENFWRAGAARSARQNADTVARKAYQLRDAARVTHPLGRCADCGFRPVGEVALMRRPDGGHTIGGLLTCGSVWACPACALKIKAGRAEEIKAGAALHRLHHGAESMAMLSLTIRHDSSMRLRTLRDGLQAAHNDFFRLVPTLEKLANDQAKRTGAPRQKWQTDLAFIGYVSGTEVTHGAAGWHPHRHYLLAFSENVLRDDLARLRNVLAYHWRDCVIRYLGEACAPDLAIGLDLRPLRIAEYLSKLGLEISDVGVKEAKGGNETPWGLMSQMSEGNGAALDAFAEYARAMKGAKCVQFSEALKRHWDRLGAKPEGASDAELADDTAAAVVVLEIPREVWYRLRCSGRVRQFLEACDDGLEVRPEWGRPPGWGDQERAIDLAEHGSPPRLTPEGRREKSRASLATYFDALRLTERPKISRRALPVVATIEEPPPWIQEALWNGY